MNDKPLVKRKCWGGFVYGRLHYRDIDTGWVGWGGSLTSAPAIFAFRRDALREYQDVRAIEIREITASKRDSQ